MDEEWVTRYRARINRVQHHANYIPCPACLCIKRIVRVHHCTPTCGGQIGSAFTRYRQGRVVP